MESGVVDVDEDPNRDASQFHRGHELDLMNLTDHLNAFQFDDQLILDQDMRLERSSNSIFVTFVPFVLNSYLTSLTPYRPK